MSIIKLSVGDRIIMKKTQEGKDRGRSSCGADLG